jgi:ABC-type transporter Mla subunit MlaD
MRAGRPIAERRSVAVKPPRRFLPMPSHRRTLARRVIVTAGAIATVGAGAGIVRLAELSAAAGATPDAAPAAMTSVRGQIDQQATRAASLPTSAATLGDEVRAFVDAVTSASASTDLQTARATRVANDLAAAKARLATVQGQLTAASGRLAALVAAGAKLAASRQGKGRVVATTGASGTAGAVVDN